MGFQITKCYKTHRFFIPCCYIRFDCSRTCEFGFKHSTVSIIGTCDYFAGDGGRKGNFHCYCFSFLFSVYAVFCSSIFYKDALCTLLNSVFLVAYVWLQVSLSVGNSYLFRIHLYELLIK